MEVQRFYGMTLKPVSYRLICSPFAFMECLISPALLVLRGASQDHILTCSIQIIITEGPLAGKKVLVLQDLQAFRFLELPAEIRNMIYSHLFEDGREVQIGTYKPHGKPRRPVSPTFRTPGWGTKPQGAVWDSENGKWDGQEHSSHAILRVCRQLLSEAAPVAYGGNIYGATRFCDLNLFLTSIGSMRRFLRHVRLPNRQHGSSSAVLVFKALRDALDLRSVIVSHTNACDARTRTWYSYYLVVTPKVLAHWLRPILNGIVERQLAVNEAAETDVLDIVKIDCVEANRWRVDIEYVCARCNAGDGGVCTRIDCAIPCKDRATHVAELQKKFRSAIAKALDME